MAFEFLRGRFDRFLERAREVSPEVSPEVLENLYPDLSEVLTPPIDPSVLAQPLLSETTNVVYLSPEDLPPYPTDTLVDPRD